MDAFLWLIIIAIGLISYTIYEYILKKPKGYEILVNYSEKVGDVIIESDKEYKGYVDEEKDVMVIRGTKLKRPTPPRKVMLSTRTGKRKVYLLKIDADRYAYRIPSNNNEIYVYKRDEYGNIIKNNSNKPILIKHKYMLCDDVVEQDVKHWEEWMQEQNKKNHSIKKDMLERWLAPAAIVLIFLFAMITIQQVTKMTVEDKRIIMERSEQMQEDAQRTTKNMNVLIEKITGQKVLEDEKTEEEKRQEYQDSNT